VFGIALSINMMLLTELIPFPFYYCALHEPSLSRLKSGWLSVGANLVFVPL